MKSWQLATFTGAWAPYDQHKYQSEKRRSGLVLQ
jgi:hypothetical protein